RDFQVLTTIEYKFTPMYGAPVSHFQQLSCIISGKIIMELNRLKRIASRRSDTYLISSRLRKRDDRLTASISRARNCRLVDIHPSIGELACGRYLDVVGSGTSINLSVPNGDEMIGVGRTDVTTVAIRRFPCVVDRPTFVLQLLDGVGNLRTGAIG